MAQQIFDQYAPLAKVSANETIPVVAAIAQTRDGKDELLLGNVPFVPGPGGLYVPVSASNRLPVEATLSGQIPSGSNIIGRVDTVGSSVVVETLLDAESVLPGIANMRLIRVDVHGYDACYLAVSTDKAPWTMTGSVGPFTPRVNVSPNAFYPPAENITKTSSSTFPLVFLFTTVINGNVPHESFEDAWRHRWRGDGHGPLSVYFTNRSSDTATVTVKAIKVKGG